MDVTTLIKQYFDSPSTGLTVDVFDGKNIYSVYQRIVGMLTQHIEIEISVLQAMSYCFYEILDNVLTHSGKELGVVITQYNPSTHRLRFLVADDGMGIRESLSENQAYANISEGDALRECIKDSVTDGKGMGFGLYSTALLARDAGLSFQIHSGSSKLLYQNDTTEVLQAEPWQGTTVFLELQTNKEINPHDVVANRTDCAAEYNETFLQDKELNELW